MRDGYAIKKLSTKTFWRCVGLDSDGGGWITLEAKK